MMRVRIDTSWPGRDFLGETPCFLDRQFCRYIGGQLSTYTIGGIVCPRNRDRDNDFLPRSVPDMVRSRSHGVRKFPRNPGSRLAGLTE